MKFGGTSVGSAEAIKKTAEITSKKAGAGIVVVSALSGVTDLLVEINDLLEKHEYKKAKAKLEEIRKRHIDVIRQLGLGEETAMRVEKIITRYKEYIQAVIILEEISLRTKDMFLSAGEQLSSLIITDYYKAYGLNARRVDTGKIIKTDSSFSRAKIDFEKTKQNCLTAVKVFDEGYDTLVCGGFFGSDARDEITTLGRGGSDKSAAVIAGAVGADTLEIYTDVPGILTCDPRIVEDAGTLARVSYKEAAEMAVSGAKVLHPSTIRPAVENNIPVFVKSTFDPDNPGTGIFNETVGHRDLKAIAIGKSQIVIKMTFSEKSDEFNDLMVLTGLMEKYGLSTNAMTLQNNSLTVAVDSIDDSEELFFLSELTSEYRVVEHISAVSLIGEEVGYNQNLMVRVETLLRDNHIPVVFRAISEMNLTYYIPDHMAVRAARILHVLCK